MTIIPGFARFAVLVMAAMGIVAPAYGQQQQWAAAYIDWTFDGSPGGEALAQDMWVPNPSRASFFTLNFDFATGQGGYIGLQSNEVGAGNVRFSLWNTTVARGEACRPFDGEGEGMTCVLPISIDPARVYRVRVTRDAADVNGQWWVGWLETPDGVRRQIGAIRVPHQHRTIAGEGVHNFSEYWGDAVTACAAAPLSAAVFAQPVLKVAPGSDSVGSQPNGTRPPENACITGRELRGAAVTHTRLTLRGAPAMAITLGGSPNDNVRRAGSLASAAPEH